MLSIIHNQRLTFLRDLLWELVGRDMKLRYKRSVLGVAWSLINPLLQMLVFTFVFRSVIVLNIPNYPIFVFTSVLVWNWFSSAWLMATGSITDSRELVKRPGFPILILPMVPITTQLIHFLLAFPILLFFILLSASPLTGALLFLPLVILIQFVLMLGLGYLTATFQVRFHDTQHLLSVLMMILFYLTPIVYDASLLPTRFRFIYNLNPIAHLIIAYRTILVQGNLPDFAALSFVSLFAGILLWASRILFTRASWRFAEEL